MASGRYFFYRDILPLAALFTAESTNVGVSVLYKAAVTKGLSYHVFMFYSYAISALLVLPLAYFFHRKSSLPPFSVVLIGKFFILGFLGFSGQYLGYIGISLSNPTLGSAMSNLNPASTFILAILFRMERLNLRSVSSQAKIIGTLVTIAGAFVVVLYKGPILISTGSEIVPLPNSSVGLGLSPRSVGTVSAQSNWVVGGALLAPAYIISSFWYIVQSKVVQAYPAEFVIVFFYNLFAGIISLPVCMLSEPNLEAWIVPADVRLVSVLYAGIVGCGFVMMVHTWGLHVKGPVYVALFKPLSIAIAAILGVLFLGDDLSLGSVIGSIIISMGFYTVLWGKSKEERYDVSNDYIIESSNNPVAPLLKNYSVSTKGNGGV